jgi:branched-chain amino acid transport system ATP-binding protein
VTVIETAGADPAAGAADALHVEHLDAGYGTTTIVRDVSLRVAAGTVTALLGPNGAGKTTLLRTISGFIHPTAGHVAIGGHDVTKWRPHKRAALGLCHVPEGRGIFRSLTVRENLQMQAVPGTESDAIERAASAFPILGQRLEQRAGTMSGGQQQMLAMASAYVRNPSLVLIDEASLGLAPIIVDEIFAFLAGRAAEGAALLIVDQFVARALQMATTAYVLQRGTIAFEGTADELRDSDVFSRYLGATADDGTSHQ